MTVVALICTARWVLLITPSHLEVRNVHPFHSRNAADTSLSSMTETNSTETELRREGSDTDTDSCEKRSHEGGGEAWRTVVGSLLVYYSSFGIMNSFGFFQDFYSHDFLKNTPASTIAFCGTLQMFLMNSLAAVSGALCDRFGVTVRLFPLNMDFADGLSTFTSVRERVQSPHYSCCPLYNLAISGRSCLSRAC